jgi:hypothetical protein
MVAAGQRYADFVIQASNHSVRKLNKIVSFKNGLCLLMRFLEKYLIILIQSKVQIFRLS